VRWLSWKPFEQRYGVCWFEEMISVGGMVQTFGRGKIVVFGLNKKSNYEFK
jgi:hypothetical protein